MIYKLVLVRDIHKAEEDGWRLVNNRVHKVLGDWDWSSVYMTKEDDGELGC